MSEEQSPPTAEDFDAVFSAVAESDALRAVFRDGLQDEHVAEADQFSFVTASLLDAVAAALRLGPSSTLVDVACGRGGPGLVLARRHGCRLIGVDWSAVAVEHAQERAAGADVDADYRVGDATETGLPDGLADGAMMIDAFQLLPDKLGAARELARIVRPGGRVAVTTWETLSAVAGRVPASVPALLEEAGLVVEHVEDRPGDLALHRRIYELAIERDDGSDKALHGLRDEADATLPQLATMRRILAVALRPG